MATADRGAPLFDKQRDYNHATDNTYKNLRQQAEQMYEKRQKLSSQSQQAYKRGDKEEAHRLSEESKKALAQAENYNRQAAEYVFRENNADSAADEIDLHGLYVKEAEWILQKRLSECMRTNQSHLKVIVGKGLHSQNGVAKLKPAVDQLCNESGLKHHIDPKNTGVLVIDLTGSSSAPSHWDQTPLSSGAQGYSSQQHPHYQQQSHQQQTYQQGQNQGQNQFKTGNSLVDALLGLFCQCISK